MLHPTMSLIEDGTISLPYEGGSASSPTVLRNRRTLLRGRRDAVPPDVAFHDVVDLRKAIRLPKETFLQKFPNMQGQ